MSIYMIIDTHGVVVDFLEKNLGLTVQLSLETQKGADHLS